MPGAPDQTSFRYTLGHFPAGVTVMTTCLGDRLHGMTVSAFCSVSLDPLLVLVCVEKTTRMHEFVSQSQVYGINILGAADEAVSRFFADDSRLQSQEFTPGTYRLGVTGCPLLLKATAHLEARVQAAYDGGDHTVFLGRVAALDVRSETRPLIFYRGGYTTLRDG